MRPMPFRVLLVSVVAWLSCAASAGAGPITVFEFAGTVTNPSAFIPSLPIATDVRFYVPFDYGTTDLCASAGSGLYSFPGATIAYGGVSYSSQFTSLEVNAPDGNCQSLPANSPQNLTLRMINFAGAPFFSATIDLATNPTGGGSIPLFFSPGLGFSVNFVGQGFGGAGAATGPITGITAIPEPASLTLILSGLGWAAARRRNKHRQS